MEILSIILDNDDEFAKKVHADDALKDGGDLSLTTKTDEKTGRGIAVLSFSVELQDGTKVLAQIVTTVALLNMMNASLRGRYEDDGTPL